MGIITKVFYCERDCVDAVDWNVVLGEGNLAPHFCRGCGGPLIGRKPIVRLIRELSTPFIVRVRDAPDMLARVRDGHDRSDEDDGESAAFRSWDFVLSRSA